jgi:lysophospholipase L1-like esterase
VVVAVPLAASASGSGNAVPDRWVNAWQGSPVEGGTIAGSGCPADQGLDNQTVRNIVFLSAGGGQVRVRLTNAFGKVPVRIGTASVAIAGDGAAAVPASNRTLSFAGHPSVLLAAGGEALSDPVSLSVNALQELDVSVYAPSATGPATQHFDAQQTNYIASGNQASRASGAAYRTTSSCWLLADGVDVLPAARVKGTVVTLGDSITDGAQSTQNTNHRYPDYLARRLNAVSGPTLSVSNAGISGNDLLTFRTDLPFGAVFGVPAPGRLPRDVLTQPGAKSVILLEGINDIGAFSAKARDLIQADEQIVAQSHAAGLKVYGATLTPFGGSNGQYGGDYGTAAGEQQRQKLNHWIRTSGAFDAVFDFDKAVRDPQHPDRMLPQYDSGDHLHPGDAGYQKMAEAVDLGVLLQSAT